MATYYKDNVTGEIVDEAGNEAGEAFQTQMYQEKFREAEPFKTAMLSAGRRVNNAPVNLGISEPDTKGPGIRELQEQSPIAGMIGDAYPYLATIPGGLVAQVLGGGALGALFSEPGEGARDAAIGGAGGGLGHMAGRILSNIMGGSKQVLPGFTRGSAKDVAATGGRVTLGEATGLESIKSLERAIEVTPAGKLANTATRTGRAKNVERLTREALEIGDQNLKGFGQDAIEAARAVSRGKYAELNNILPDMEIPADLADDLRTYLGQSSRLKASMIKKGVNNFDGEGAMDTSSEALLDMRSRISKRNRTPSNDSPIYDDIIDSIDDLIESNTSGEVLDQFTQTRAHYRTLKAVESSMNNSGLSTTRLANRLRGGQSAGAIGDLQKNVAGLTSGDFAHRYGNSGTGEALMGVLSLPFSPGIYGASKLLNSAADLGTIPTRYGSTLGRAGLLGSTE